MSAEFKLPTKGLMSLVDEKFLEAIESALALNDLSKLTTEQKISYYNAVCTSVGLNPLTQPFAYIKIDGKLVLYARKECSEQLRKMNGISTQFISKEQIGDYYEVHIKATDKDGRSEEDIAIVSLLDNYGKMLTGNHLANAIMKCSTKAKRRATLALSGLGMIDESEIETIPKNVLSAASNPQLPDPFGRNKETASAEPKKEAEVKPLTIDAKKIEPDLGSFICEVGKKYKGKKLSEIDQFDLNNYVQYLLKEGFEQLKPDFKKFVQNAEAYLKSKEVKKAEPKFDAKEVLA